MKKRTLSLMLAAAMVLGSLTGCSTGQKEESKETAAVTEAAKAGEDAAAAAHRKQAHSLRMERKRYMHLYLRQRQTPYSF